jgi:hypothetical protein
MWICSMLWVASVSGWVYHRDISNSVRAALPPNLTNFTLASYSALNLVIIYGGFNATYYSDRTFVINLTNNQVH